MSPNTPVNILEDICVSMFACLLFTIAKTWR